MEEILKRMGYRRMVKVGERSVYGKPVGFHLFTVTLKGNKWNWQNWFVGPGNGAKGLWNQNEVTDLETLKAAEAYDGTCDIGTALADFTFRTNEQQAEALLDA